MTTETGNDTWTTGDWETMSAACRRFDEEWGEDGSRDAADACSRVQAEQDRLRRVVAALDDYLDQPNGAMMAELIQARGALDA